MPKKRDFIPVALFLAVLSFVIISIDSCSSREKYDTARYTVSGEKIPADSLKDRSNRDVYKFNVSYYDMTLSANGKLSVTEQGGGSFKITAFQDTSLSLRALEYSTFEKDLILLYQLNKGREDWSEIARISPGERKVKWKTRFGSFNLSTALIDGKYLYGSTIGYVGKVDLKKGKIVWGKDDLWDNYKANNFEKIFLSKDTVIFIGKVYMVKNKTMTGEARAFKYNKHTGEELIR